MESEHRSATPHLIALTYRNISTSSQSTFYNVYKYFLLFLTFVIYVSYHLSRKPLSVVKNQLNPCSDVNGTSSNCTGGWEPFDGSNGKQKLGALDSCFLFTYAFFMFISGHVAERMNLRYFLFGGMFLSGVTTALFGLGKVWAIHSFWYFALIQVLSGVVQSSGWPPVVACVANWFGKGRRGFIMGIWNSHTSVGNILGSVIAGSMVNVDWAWSFIIPGIIILALGFLVFLTLVPHPNDFTENVNYSSIPDREEGTERARLINEGEDDDEQDSIIANHSETPPRPGDTGTNEGAAPIGFLQAITIPGVIEFSLCLFFAKLVSYTFLFWLPFYISKTGNYDSSQAADLSTLFDIGGIMGGIAAGFTSDYHGGRALTCMTMLSVAAPVMFAYYFFGGVSFGLSVFLLMLCGFFVNGPYSLITTAVSADLGTHPSLKGNSRALSTVTAIIDGTGSVGAAVGPLLTGVISSHGWDYVFYMLIVSDIVALLVSAYVYFLVDVNGDSSVAKNATIAAANGESVIGVAGYLSWRQRWQLAWSESNRWLPFLPNLALLLLGCCSCSSCRGGGCGGGGGGGNRLPRISCCSLSPYRFRVSLGQWLGMLFAILFFVLIYLFTFGQPTAGSGGGGGGGGRSFDGGGGS